MITIEDAQKAREMKEIADLPEVSKPRRQVGHLSLEEAFVVAAFKGSDK